MAHGTSLALRPTPYPGSTPGFPNPGREAALEGLRDLAARLRGEEASSRMAYHPHGFGGGPVPMTASEILGEAQRHVGVLHANGTQAARDAMDGLGVPGCYGTWGHHQGYAPIDTDARRRIADAIDRLVRSLQPAPAPAGWLHELREASRHGLGRLCLLGLRQEVLRAAEGVGPVPGFPGRGVQAALGVLQAATHATVQDVAALSWIDATETPEPARLAAAVDALQAIVGRKAARAPAAPGLGQPHPGWMHEL